ncbi:hypothetical protein BGZ80_011474 [Entomortierella chlamydospora]|uniref:Uncharacterized protein n=1 Tax=Entomortierella chlamydospora TaxID=101097 RepID=A0A9P6MU54_9FUNG|nr:hypothetical protein BGZ79_010616 [Entomortierella chlamydospora]KAG0012843.1 hypothetical protein BGZ80_011474 [Entomortierella chlamydospora]
MGKASSNSDKNSHDGVESSTSDNVRVPNDEERALLSHNDTQKNNNYYSSATTSALQDQTQGGSSSSRSNRHHTSTASEQERELLKRRRIRNALMIILPVLSTIFLLWTLSGQSNPGPTDSDGKYEWLGSALGWCSAMLYLGSRIPQIYKNWRLQSCEGLSIFMFVFSVLGNVTYVASILLNSMDHDYLIKNMPWCLGSGGTLIFDFMIFGQFYLYRHNMPTASTE